MQRSVRDGNAPDSTISSPRRRPMAYFSAFWRGDSLYGGGILAGIAVAEIEEHGILAGDVIFPISESGGAILVRGRFVFREILNPIGVPEFEADLLETTILPPDIAAALLPATIEAFDGSDIARHMAGVRRLSRSQGELLEICVGNTEATRRWKPSTQFGPENDLPPALLRPDIGKLFQDIACHETTIDRTPEPAAIEHRVRTFHPRKVDFSRIATESKRIGDLGEEFVVDYERGVLEDAGRYDLAARVVRISESLGDGVGYDVLSFSIDGAERFIEVKTTIGGKRTPFLVTINEVVFSEINADRYRLFRVFSVNSRPKFFILEGSLRTAVRLEPVQFRACF